LIFNGLAGTNMDAIEEELKTLDKCLSHTSPNGDLHYHSLTPCMKIGSPTQKPGLCTSDSDCMDHVGSFATLGWEDKQDYGGVYGIARDGHVIYGPYNAEGEIWNCDDHDACNGFFLDDGSYGYASTVTFPYIVGCWGPGPIQTTAASCSSTGCSATEGLKLLTAAAASVVALSLIH
jgi:hypothetical protein